MIKAAGPKNIHAAGVDEAAIDGRFITELDNLHRRTDRFFAKLLLVEWLAAIAMALFVSPLTWTGKYAQPNFHLYSALFFGATITLFPAWLGFRQSGSALTRHVLAAA